MCRWKKAVLFVTNSLDRRWVKVIIPQSRFCTPARNGAEECFPVGMRREVDYEFA